MQQLKNDALLKQLGYNVNEASLAQLERIMANTKGFSNIYKHLIPLNDELKVRQSYIAMSNSEDYLKIKNEALNMEIKKEVEDLIFKWVTKYKVDLEKVNGKDTYYIKGLIS